MIPPLCKMTEQQVLCTLSGGCLKYLRYVIPLHVQACCDRFRGGGCKDATPLDTSLFSGDLSTRHDTPPQKKAEHCGFTWSCFSALAFRPAATGQADPSSQRSSLKCFLPCLSVSWLLWWVKLTVDLRNVKAGVGSACWKVH